MVNNEQYIQFIFDAPNVHFKNLNNYCKKKKMILFKETFHQTLAAATGKFFTFFDDIEIFQVVFEKVRFWFSTFRGHAFTLVLLSFAFLYHHKVKKSFLKIEKLHIDWLIFKPNPHYSLFPISIFVFHCLPNFLFIHFK